MSEKYTAVIKSKDNKNYLLKVKGRTEKLVKKKGLKKCKEAGNTGCYVHWTGIEPDFY